MDSTPRLNLPYIAPQQAQKQVTFNAAMAALDQLVQAAVRSRTITVPPGSPAEGDLYLVAPAATGAWAGKDGRLASFAGGAWSFRDTADGWQVYVADTAEIAIRAAGAWSTMLTNGGASIAKFGINATADLTNRLALAADASLFSHDGTSHRLKINKASAADTASLLLQSNSSGRAELGLAGDDSLHLKVSPNGSSWFEALAVAPASGLVSLPLGQLAFPATQNPSAGANVLDDYEEGAWTPVLTFGGASVGMTYSPANTNGRYTKIGRQVFVNAMLTLTSKGSSTGAALLGGLPFTSAAVNFSALAVGYAANLTSVTGAVLALVSPADTRLAFYHSNNGNGGALSNANFANTTTIYLSGCYDAA